MKEEKIRKFASKQRTIKEQSSVSNTETALILCGYSRERANKGPSHCWFAGDSGPIPVLPTPALQCTTRGPSLSGQAPDDFLMNERTGRIWLGVPWSGQAVYWYCTTSLTRPVFSFLPTLRWRSLSVRIVKFAWTYTGWKVNVRRNNVIMRTSSLSRKTSIRP